MTRDNFNWGAENNGDVVLRAYGSIAVHGNPYGDVVIRQEWSALEQERSALEDEDQFVVIPVQDAEPGSLDVLRIAHERKLCEASIGAGKFKNECT